eukprot:CAMPEP_0196583268 /NCGR_PEP_ID=MMETSP1081-20130531/42768_1 /TAXON_ID=36882 /ORGANISM="Pyramimonas amylifera, Strain CCMP720" /LENGTH=216 /DNA_ID=CAMNT_0041904097 /DNA_START=51 /DNA_END=701 /DNA_ORIENTATION=-
MASFTSLQSLCRASNVSSKSCHRVQNKSSTTCSKESFKKSNIPAESSNNRREIVLNSVSGLFFAAIFDFRGDSPRLGLTDYGDFKSLQLCPSTPNCISTAEESNNYTAFVPAWTYGTKKTKEQAMEELKATVLACDEGGFVATIVEERDDYLRAEFQGPIFGFVDDVEFYFSPKVPEVEYRSASRLGEKDGDANRKRIRALRKALQKQGGWESVGF